MKKEIQGIINNYYKEQEIDPRTLPMIVAHYLSIGEQAASKLTDEKIQEVYKRAVEEEEQAAAHGSTTMITPEFQRYILKACQQLALLPREAKNAIIKAGL